MSTALQAAILGALAEIRTLASRAPRIRMREVTFTTSGSFVPADYGIQAGSALDVLVVGAGASGVYSSGSTAHGGNGGEVVRRRITVTSTQAVVGFVVVVGTGGQNPVNYNTSGGSSSSFGSVVVAAGGASSGGSGATTGGHGALSPASGRDGGRPFLGFARGGNALATVRTPRPNSGDGGDSGTSAATTQSGSNGYVQVSWPEIVP